MNVRLALLAALFAFAAAPLPLPAQDPPSEEDPKEKKKRMREEEAGSLFEKSKKLFEDGKFQEAQDQLKTLRSRYFTTRAFMENSEAIDSMITDCGFKVAAAGMASIKINKKQAHIDTLLGFQFNPPEGWRGIPNWQKLFGQADTSEADWRGNSFRVTRYTSKWLESLHLKAYKTYAPTSIEEVIEGEEKTWTRSPFEGMEEIASDNFQGVHAGKRVQKKDAAGNRMVIYAFMENKKGFGLVGYWRTDEDEGGWIIKRGGDEKKKRGASDEEWAAALKVFDQVAKTFMIMNQAQLSGMRGTAKTWGISSDGWCVKCVDWGVIQTERYTIEYQTKKEFAEKLGKELEQIYRLYQAVIPSAKTQQRCRVKLFDNQEDFQYYGQAPGAAAYWSPAQEEIVAYRFEGGKVTLDSKEEMTVAEERTAEQTTFSILYHECFHQYMYYLMGRDRGVYVPSWLNEGMGDYFFGGRWEKSKFVIGPNEWRLKTIVRAVKEGKHVPLEKIFRYTQQDYYSNAGLCYAEGWAINYFFLSEAGKKAGYHQIPPRMFETLRKSGDWKSATDAAFAGIDLKKMEEEWKTFVLGMEKLLPKGALDKPDEEPKKED